MKDAQCSEKCLHSAVHIGSVSACRQVQLPIIKELENDFAVLIASLAENVYTLSQSRRAGLKACIEEKLKALHGQLPVTIPSTAEDLMSTASDYWNFLNIEVVQVAMHYLGKQNPELLMEMQAYEKNLQDKASQLLKYCEKKNLVPMKPPRCSSMLITMNVDPHSYSLQRILEVKDFLVYQIRVDPALFAGWRHGSIILHFYFLESDKEAAIQRLKECKSQLKRMQVVAVEVDGISVLSMTPNVVTEANVDVGIDSVAKCFEAGSNLVRAMEGFGRNMGSVQSLGGVVDKIKSIIGDSVKAALEVAHTFFDKVIDVFYHGRGDSMAAAIEGLQCSPPDMQPLRSLLRQLGNALAEAAAKYSEFVGACVTAIHRCTEATDWCSEHSEGETTRDKWGRRVGGGVAAATGTALLAVGVVAGLATFGLGFPYAAAGGGYLYGASQILNDTPKARIRNINDTFHALNSNAYDLHSTMAPVHTTVENIVVQINSPHFSAETANIRSLRNAMNRLKTACANSYRTISRFRQQVR